MGRADRARAPVLHTGCEQGLKALRQESPGHSTSGFVFGGVGGFV